MLAEVTMNKPEETQESVIATEEESRGIYLPFIDATVGELIETSRTAIADLQQASASKDAVIEQRNLEIDALHKTIAAKNEKIGELEEMAKAGAELEAQVKTLTTDLGMARMLLKSKAGIPQGIERLEGGGIRLAVTLDEDAAVPFLSQAECAGEDPAVFIQRQLEEALLAFAAS
jgi:hypothetical protein